MRIPVRYFVLNTQTPTMHIFGLCRHTKKRPIPIRLFDSREELEAYAGRPLSLCRVCQKEYEKMK